MTTTTYLWDTESDNLLSEDDGTSATTYTNEPTQFGDLVSQKNSLIDNTNFYHFDARGDTRELTDDSENVTDTKLYDAWGNVIESAGSAVMPFGFIGKSGYMFDSASQYHYVRARWYGPPIALWLSADPVSSVFDGTYDYANNSPLLHVDKSGWIATPCDARPTLPPVGEVEADDKGYCSNPRTYPIEKYVFKTALATIVAKATGAGGNVPGIVQHRAIAPY